MDYPRRSEEYSGIVKNIIRKRERERESQCATNNIGKNRNRRVEVVWSPNENRGSLPTREEETKKESAEIMK